MGSRIRENPDHLFVCFCEVVIPADSDTQPWILQKFPEEFDNEEVLKSVPEFSCPCEFTNDAVQHFSFVLTSLDSKWTYGFCRQAPNQSTLFCFLSFLPWHETFYRLLNYVSDLTNDPQAGPLPNFLEMLYNYPVPEPGSTLHVTYNMKNFTAPCPNHLMLPSIPTNRNLTEYFNAVDAHNMMVVFASMLHERRIIITSKKLSRLSACVQAANSLIYPMHWQHIFIPVLPKHLLDYVSAPMPFLIGIPSVTMLLLKPSEITEVVVLDADNNKVQTPFNDFEMLPPKIVSSLKSRLKNPNLMLGDGVARAFMRALVHLIGGYGDALKMNIGEKITFDKEAFLKTRPTSIQTFLENMLHLQIFQQFIEDRLEMLNSGVGFSDEFEQAVSSYEVNTSTRLRAQYKEWVSTMKKEGGTFLKNVKTRVKDKGKRAYKDIRSRLQDMQKHPSQPDLSYRQKSTTPKSAPSSPTATRLNAFEFTPRMSYNQNTANKHGAIDSLSFSNSISGIRKYKVLTVDEMSVASEESLSDPEDQHIIEPLNMDLMGDLQDLLFRKCSTSSDGPLPEEKTSMNKDADNDKMLLDSSVLGFDDAFCDSSDVFLPAPMPPPRTKRKAPAINEMNKEALITLDSIDDSFFDPLLSKKESDQAPPIPPKEKANILNSKTSPDFPDDVGFSPAPVYHYGLTCFLDSCPTQPDGKACSNAAVHKSETLPQIPAIPPKTGGYALSKDDKNLLEDYGLSTAPIFCSNPFSSTSQPSNSAFQSGTKPSDDFFDLLQTGNQSSSRSTWQKFV